MAVSTQELLDAVEAAIKGTLDRNAAMYQIAGRTIQSMSLSDLFNARDRLRMELQQQQQAGGLPAAYGVQEPMGRTKTA